MLDVHLFTEHYKVIDANNTGATANETHKMLLILLVC